MRFRDRPTEPISVLLFTLGIGLVVAFAMFIGLLYRGPGEVTTVQNPPGRLDQTALYREESGITSPERPNG
jgi:hypothetical protein